MPEGREEQREQMIESIGLLLNDEHPGLSNFIRESAHEMVENLRRHVEECDEDHEPVPDNLEEEIILSLKMANIAITCAWIASGTVGTDEDGNAPYIVLGKWAGMLMASHEIQAIHQRLRNALGLGDN